MTHFLVPSVLLFSSVWVIFSDLFYRRIHNVLILGLLGAWCLMVLASLGSAGSSHSWGVSDLCRTFGFSLLGSLCVLVAGFGLFLLGQMGAGDAKLMSVLCLWVGYDDQWGFLVVTALAGGVLALCLPLLSLVELVGAKVIVQLSDRFPRLSLAQPIIFSDEEVKGLPYGLAIACGAFYSLVSPFSS